MQVDNQQERDAGQSTFGCFGRGRIERRESFSDWTMRGGCALLDQFAFSTANFVLHLLLIRWFSPEEFGRFALLFSIVLMGGTIHQSVIISPMMVFSSGRFLRYQRSYLSQVIIGAQGVLLGVIGVIGFGIIWRLGVDLEFAWIIIGGILLLSVWTARKACYAIKRPGAALVGSLLYTTLIISGMIFLNEFGALTLPRVFLVIAAGSAGSLLFYGRQLHLQLPRLDQRLLCVIYRRHFLYGKWALGKAIVTGSAAHLVLIGLGLIHGFGAVALLRAAQLLMLPVFQARVSLGNLILPYLVESRTVGSDFVRKVIVVGILMTGVTLLYCTTLIILYPIVDAYLLNGKYPDSRPIIGILGLGAVVGAVVAPAYSGLAALERPDIVFWPQIVGILLALTAGSSLILFFGENGAAAATVLLIGLPGVLVARTFWTFIAERGRFRSVEGLPRRISSEKPIE